MSLLVEQHIAQSATQTKDITRLISTKCDVLEEQSQVQMKAHTTSQQLVVAGLDRNERTLTTLRGSMKALVIGQRQAKRTRENEKHTLSHNHTAVMSKLEEIQNAQYASTSTTRDTLRNIYVYGEEPDMLVGYLRVVTREFETVVDHLALNGGNSVCSESARLIRTELHSILGSAGQELLREFTDHPVKSTDKWLYSEDHFKSSGKKPMSRRLAWPAKSHRAHGFTSGAARAGEALQREGPSRGTFDFPTPTGHFRMQVPQKRSGPDVSHEQQRRLELTFTGTDNQPFRKFAVEFMYQRSMLTVHLNVFTQCPDGRAYDVVRRGSIAQIDAALRNGTISPYHLYSNGMPYCLLVRRFSMVTEVIR